MTIWSVAAYLLLPFVVLNLFWRGIRYPAYWFRWPERFGYLEPMHGQKVIWVHAVSVGEVRSSVELINELAERFPRHRILVTTMTPTGSEQVKELFGGRVGHAYVPYDFPGSVRRFMARVSPEFAVVAETEFWPNLFKACKDRGIPLFLVNVRLSQESLRGYLRVPRTARTMLERATVICAQTNSDAQRLKSLGVTKARIEVTGNLKFDAPLPDTLLSESREIRQQWGSNRPILIAASTHRGEERGILSAFEELRRTYEDLLLVLAPRHPERFRSVFRLCRQTGAAVALRSRQDGALVKGTDIVVGDTMGELQRLYAAADIAFVGGSLVGIGGHNLLEPCAVGVPVIFGPRMFHFEDISRMVLERGAGCQIPDASGLADSVSLYLQQPALREAASQAAQQLVAENRGAVERTLQVMSGSARWSELKRGAADPVSALRD
ncbi:MAG: lipid IV(A) 3-deoxy-D-manno-octulosonic acid transferase [Candidatus Rariloculaceae bacterium]